MKTFSADPNSNPNPVPPRLDRSKAWTFLVTNLLVMPGLGSVMARRKTAGYLQIVLSLAGFLITLGALIKFALFWVHDFEMPDDPALYRAAIIGIAIFIGAWLWSLVTSLAIFRQGK